MSWLRRIAEREAERARGAGDLSGLAGEGRPLDLPAPASGMDPVEAAGFRPMKAESAVPPEVARDRLKAATDAAARRAAMAELAETSMRLAPLSVRRRG